jgi:hypothetical protein
MLREVPELMEIAHKELKQMTGSERETATWGWRNKVYNKNPVKNNQQMLKAIFIVLIELPRHVSASKCHLQGVTHSS